MAQFVVGNLEEEVKARLQRRAARHGQSMEDEVRNILRDAVKEDEIPAASWVRTRPATHFSCRRSRGCLGVPAGGMRRMAAEKAARFVSYCCQVRRRDRLARQAHDESGAISSENMVGTRRLELLTSTVSR
jgi:antitoxin FitA